MSRKPGTLKVTDQSLLDVLIFKYILKSSTRKEHDSRMSYLSRDAFLYLVFLLCFSLSSKEAEGL